MAGDRLIAAPLLCFTHAIDIAAPPERVWPWLAQMGAGRGGWYSWDRLDNGGRRSAEGIVPELQEVARGDVLPALPGASDAFVVVDADPPRDLLLCWPAPEGTACATWEYAVEEPAPGRSRLLSRARLGPDALRVARTGRAATARQPAVERLHHALLGLPLGALRPLARAVHWVMQSRALRGIRRRAERRYRYERS
jgi:hypothetical protein